MTMKNSENPAARAGRVMSVPELLAATSRVEAGLVRDLGEAFLHPAEGAATVRMSEVAPEEIDWLWDRWIPRRMLTILGGNGGEGKSTVMASLIGTWTTGGLLPDGSRVPQNNVLVLNAEDNAAYVLRPRLDVHEADVSRVISLQGTIRCDGQTRLFDLRRDVEAMQEVITDHQVGVVVIDPLNSYLPNWDRNKLRDMKNALRPLLGLMTSTGVGVVGILDIGKPGANLQANQHVAGVLSLAQSVLMIASQPEERQPDDVAEMGKLKVLQVVRSNHSIPPVPQAFRRPLNAPIAWLGESDVGIEECFLKSTFRERGRPATECNDSVEFLQEMLAEGPVLSSEILTQAGIQGFSERTLRRAKKKLGVIAQRDGAVGVWRWTLPPSKNI